MVNVRLAKPPAVEMAASTTAKYCEKGGEKALAVWI
jgi:hypothetical protein